MSFASSLRRLPLLLLAVLAVLQLLVACSSAAGDASGAEDSSFLVRVAAESGATASQGASGVDAGLSYSVLQTIKSSYTSFGPLQCETTCEVRSPKPLCEWAPSACASSCRRQCEAKEKPAARGTWEARMCEEGCTLLCPFAPLN
eukprot:PLAT2991.1.p2 GENE.PLAT2991.1~~PLAT2991.1.p2  ORF type:complete len:161 (-),score=45.74 PLAT2991.1:311-745(-)